MTVTNQSLLTSELAQVSHQRTCDTTGMSETITSGSPPPVDSQRPVLHVTVCAPMVLRHSLGFEHWELGENWNGYGEKAVHGNASGP